jgi:hypothetical protein
MIMRLRCLVSVEELTLHSSSKLTYLPIYLSTYLSIYLPTYPALPTYTYIYQPTLWIDMVQVHRSV